MHPDPHNPGTISIDEPIYNFCRSTFNLETQPLAIHCLGILGLGTDSACFLFMCRALRIPFFVRGKTVLRTGNGVDPGWLAARYLTNFRRIRSLIRSDALYQALVQLYWKIIRDRRRHVT